MIKILFVCHGVDRIAGAVPDFFAAGGSGSDLEVGSEVLFFHQIL